MYLLFLRLHYRILYTDWYITNFDTLIKYFYRYHYFWELDQNWNWNYIIEEYILSKENCPKFKDYLKTKIIAKHKCYIKFDHLRPGVSRK